MKIAPLALVLLCATPALAQREPLRPAPVPGIDSGRPTPADRAGRSDAADSSAPFAASPSGMINRAPDANRLVPPSSTTPGQTPDLSR